MNAPQTAPITAQRVQRTYPGLAPWMAHLVAQRANQRGIGVPRASDAAARPTPQVRGLSPRQRKSNHRRNLVGWIAPRRGGYQPGVTPGRVVLAPPVGRPPAGTAGVAVRGRSRRG